MKSKDRENKLVNRMRDKRDIRDGAINNQRAVILGNLTEMNKM